MNLTLDQRKARATQLRGRENRRTNSCKLELREAGEGQLQLTGYASVFDSPYDMGWYTEVIRKGAFAKTLANKADVQLLVNHIGLPLARTASGTLRLEEDEIGLRVEADLLADDPDVLKLAPKMNRGDINEMSFAFWKVRDLWDDEMMTRDLLEVKIDRGDVSVVNYGANPATSAALRSQEALELLAGLDSGKALAELREAADAGDPRELLTRARASLDELLIGMEDRTEAEPVTGLRLYAAREQLSAL